MGDKKAADGHDITKEDTPTCIGNCIGNSLAVNYALNYTRVEAAA